MSLDGALTWCTVSASGLAGLAQLPSVGLGEGGILEAALKAGAVGVVGAICIVLIRENRKAIESIEKSRSESSSKTDKAITKMAESVDRLTQHCAAKNGSANEGRR